MYELSIVRPVGYDAYDFYVYEYTGGRTGYYLTFDVSSMGIEDDLPLIKRHEITEGDIAKPIFRITGPLMASGQLQSFATTLVDWLCETLRVRPSSEHTQHGMISGKLEATELHLEDMRELVKVSYLEEPKVVHKVVD